MAEAGIDVERLRMYPGGFPREDLLVLEDFAELIVRECADFVCNYPEKYLTHNQAREISLGMEEHFGVEE